MFFFLSNWRKLISYILKNGGHTGDPIQVPNKTIENILEQTKRLNLREYKNSGFYHKFSLRSIQKRTFSPSLHLWEAHLYSIFPQSSCSFFFLYSLHLSVSILPLWFRRCKDLIVRRRSFCVSITIYIRKIQNENLLVIVEVMRMKFYFINCFINLK